MEFALVFLNSTTSITPPAVQSVSLIGNFTASQLIVWFFFMALSKGKVQLQEKVCVVYQLNCKYCRLKLLENLLAFPWYYQHIPTQYNLTHRTKTIHPGHVVFVEFMIRWISSTHNYQIRVDKLAASMNNYDKFVHWQCDKMFSTTLFFSQLLTGFNDTSLN